MFTFNESLSIFYYIIHKQFKELSEITTSRRKHEQEKLNKNGEQVTEFIFLPATIQLRSLWPDISDRYQGIINWEQLSSSSK